MFQIKIKIKFTYLSIQIISVEYGFNSELDPNLKSEINRLKNGYLHPNSKSGILTKKKDEKLI